MPVLPPLLPDRPCPVCAHQEAETLHEQRFAQVQGVGVHTGYRVVCCRACGALYAEGIPSQEAFDALYAESSKWDYAPAAGRPSSTDEGRFRTIAEELTQRLPKHGVPTLEIGCSTGGLLAALQEKGFSTLEGWDPSPACAEAVRRLYGLPAEAGTLFRPLPHGKYGCVIAIGVMEHVVDLERAFRNLRDGLAEGAQLVLEVPDAARFLESEEAPFQEFSLEHVTFFTARTLASLASRFGFALVETWHPSRVFGEASRTTSAVVLLERRSGQAVELTRDTEGREALQAYIHRDTERVRVEAAALAPLLDQPGPYAVWGAGTLTCRLAGSGLFDRHLPSFFVDANPHLQGRTLLERPISAPEALVAHQGPILLASYGFREGIRAAARGRLGLTQPLLGMDGTWL